MQCYNCDKIYSDYLGYCPYCGVKKEEFNICCDCEEKLTKDILVCPVCGGKPIEETNEMKSDRLNREGLEHSRSSRANPYFNEAIRFNKYNVDAWVNKAENLNDMTLYKSNKCCDAGLKINKDNMRLLLAKAKALKKDERNDDENNYGIILNNLLKRCNHELQENESNEEVWIIKGEVLNELDEMKEAIECYSRALEINPKNEKAWIRKALFCWLEDDYICRVEAYKKAIELNPTNDDYYRTIGDTYKNYIHDNEKAIEYYKKALEINPHCNNGYLWDDKGRLEKEMGRYDDALKSFTVLAELHHDSDNALLSKAKIYCELNRFEEAIECYDDALKISSNGYTQNLKANALIELEKYEDALEVYDESINNNPDYDETYLQKGNLLQKLGRFEEEVDCYDMLLNKDDHIYQLYKQAQLVKAIALSKIDKEKSDEYFNKILEECNHSLEIFPDDAEYSERKADILYFSGNLKESFEWYDKTLACDNLRNEELIIASKAKILYDLKDYEKAIEYFDEALEISNFLWGLQYKGYCLEELNRYDEAMECYNKCLEIDSRNKEVLLKKSELMEKIK